MVDVILIRVVSKVLYKLLKKSSGFRKMLLIFFLSSIFVDFGAAEDCNFVNCITGVRSYIFDLSLNKRSFSCKKLSDIPLCSEQCMHKYFPNAFSHSSENQLSFTKYCEEKISNRINSNSSCIAKHTYRLFACLANVNSLTTNEVREDILLTESCRKYLEFQKCPEQILQADCGKESSDAVKDLIGFILNNYRPVSCEGANETEVLLMPIYYHLGNDFVKAAKSLDDHRLEVSNCISQPIQDEIDLDGYVCGEYDPAISDCVNYVLKRKGKSYPDVRRLLLKIIALSGFKCKQSSFEPKTISSSHSSQSEEMKPDNYHSLKDETTSDLHEISTSKDIKNDNNDLKLTPELSTYAKTETEEKSEIPIKDSSDINKNNKINSASNSVNKNTKRHMNHDVNSINLCSRMNLSIHILIVCGIILLFIFR